MFKITNGNDNPFVGRFDGQDYAFPCGQPVYCPDDAAKHIFGLGQSDKSNVLSRNGWATVTGGLAVGMTILNNFKFVAVEQVYDAPLATELAHGPAPVVGDAGGAVTDGAAPSAVDDRAVPASAGRRS
jgi:hypothetical protein